MKVSYNWLKDFVNIDIPPDELAQLLTNTGFEVEEIQRISSAIKDVIVAHIVSIEKHPNADRLSLCRVSDGKSEKLIVCGAKNMKPGDKVALALPGAILAGGRRIERAKIRGIVSDGMLCSEEELGLSEISEGIMILPGDAPVGVDINAYLGLEDFILEVNITPNRPDCMSILGIAREIAAVTGVPLSLPSIRVRECDERIEDYTRITIEDRDLCPRYAARIIRGVSIGSSPFWIRSRLERCGLRSINNVVDITNYVLLEMGHPLHAFDNDLLEGREIVVRKARPGERIVTLDGVMRDLDTGMLMICDRVKPVAIAGIMGGSNTEVSLDTKNILLESAYFNPTSIRKTSKKLGLRTEASQRFERGADPENVIAAINRASQLIVEICGGEALKGIFDVYPQDIKSPEIILRIDRACMLIGFKISAEEIKNILRRLGMNVKDETENTLKVIPPSYRRDIEIEEDLVEEIARIYGYEKIPVSLPSSEITAGSVTVREDVEALVRNTLISSGYFEVINYSFLYPEIFDDLKINHDSNYRKYVTLRNPLSRKQSIMRTTLIPGLIESMKTNINRGNRGIRIFEIGRVFFFDEGIREEERIAGLACGGRYESLWNLKDVDIDFYDIKGVVEAIVDVLGIDNYEFYPASEAFLHPGKSAVLKINNMEVGFLGLLHPDVEERLEIHDIFVFELDIGLLRKYFRPERTFTELPRYPSLYRDVALIVDESLFAEEVLRMIKQKKHPWIEDVKIFDVYKGDQVPPGKKSIAFRINYRSPERTLLDEEVNLVHNEIIKEVVEKFGARIR